jgi:hypothetical protein
VNEHTWRLRRLTAGTEDARVAADETYVSVHLNRAHLEFVRRGPKKFYGLVGAGFELDSLAGGRSRFTGVHGADWLAGIDNMNLDRLVVTDVRLLGPRPYLGGDISFELGLFAQPEADLAAPFVKFLTKVSDVAGVAFLGSAGPLAPVVESGMELLFGGNRSALQIGAFGTLPLNGTFALVADDSQAPLAYRDGRLAWSSGEPVGRTYLVFTVSGSGSRSDWASIADLRSAWGDCQRAVREGHHRRVDESLAVFRRTAMTSEELLPRDGMRLADWARQVAEDALGAGPTARDGGREVPDLDACDLFATP